MLGALVQCEHHDGDAGGHTDHRADRDPAPSDQAALRCDARLGERTLRRGQSARATTAPDPILRERFATPKQPIRPAALVPLLRRAANLVAKAGPFAVLLAPRN